MSKVKEAIEEIIEESYLMGLSEDEIRLDFKRFIDACYAVIQKNVTDQKVVSDLAESLAREQTCTLIAERNDGPASVEMAGDGAERNPDELLAEKVARRERYILKTIAQYDPKLVRLIDAERFQGEAEEPARPRFRRGGRNWLANVDWDQMRMQLLKIGYATTIGLIILLIYLSFIQKT